MLDDAVGYSDTKFQSTSTLTTKRTSVKTTSAPKILLTGTEIVPQDPRDATGILTIDEQEIYPIHNLFVYIRVRACLCVSD